MIALKETHLIAHIGLDVEQVHGGCVHRAQGSIEVTRVNVLQVMVFTISWL